MLAQARKLLGTGEQPPGSNHNLITSWYGFDGAWCDMAVSYAAAHSDNLSAVMGKFAYTVAHAQAFKNAGRWHYGLGGIRPGDVVFFDWGGSGSIANIDHVGLVEAVRSNGTIVTLEGNTSDLFLRRVRSSCIVGYGRPAYGDASPMPSTDGMLRQGSTGNAVKKLQTSLNTVMKSGLATDGQFGPATTAALKAFQTRSKLEPDGVYGPLSAAMMKAALAGKATPVKPIPRPPNPGTLVVDGMFGPATCAALQRSLNSHGASLTVDGSMGPLTNRALQKYLGVAQDGIVGPATVKALQKRVGATQDGIWGTDTTRKLQTKLNAKTF
ncbi:peptidoglycan-binding protein [Dactylosporangium sp. NPDC005555]|uniref:peptidoglycan-binding protein n=1 Tax=Dactylosporangium sp. NPDC005555 TaxID=3154889 RepID=UPI0033BE36FF